MKILDIFSTASANMFRNKLRTSLTIIAIFIGAFTLTLTTGLGSGISSYIDQEIGNMGAEDALIIMGGDSQTGLPSDKPTKYDPDKKTTSIESEGNRSVTVLTDKDITKIKAISGILSAEPYLSAPVDYLAGPSSDKFVAAVNQHLTGANYAMEAGKSPSNSAAIPQVQLPLSYVSVMGFKDAENAIGKTVRFGVTDGLGKQSEVTAVVVGVQQKGLASGSSLYINNVLMTNLRKTIQVGLPPAATSAFQVAIARFDANLSDSQISSLKDRLKNAGYSGQTIKDQIGAFKAVINGIIAVLSGFAIIALLAASFGIINTLLMSIQERTKEIGLMKAMGMGSGRIFLLFSFEAILLGFWGSLVGTLAAIGAGQIINQVVLTTFLKDLTGLVLLRFSAVNIGIIVGIVMVIAFVAGTLPAIRAARQNPIDSLRYE